MIPVGARAFAHRWRAYLGIAARGWLLVTLVNRGQTVLLASERTILAMVCACVLNCVWWGNSSRHRSNVPGGGLAYGLGAALGTFTDMTIAQWCSDGASGSGLLRVVGLNDAGPTRSWFRRLGGRVLECCAGDHSTAAVKAPHFIYCVC